MTVRTAPYVPAKCDIQRIKRAVTYRRCRSVKAHNWRPACCRDMKRPGVPADEQSGATRESDELLERRGKYADAPPGIRGYCLREGFFARAKRDDRPDAALI